MPTEAEKAAAVLNALSTFSHNDRVEVIGRNGVQWLGTVTFDFGYDGDGPSLLIKADVAEGNLHLRLVLRQFVRHAD